MDEAVRVSRCSQELDPLQTDAHSPLRNGVASPSSTEEVAQGGAGAPSDEAEWIGPGEHQRVDSHVTIS
jgi:hypothetical protein